MSLIRYSIVGLWLSTPMALVEGPCTTMTRSAFTLQPSAIKLLPRQPKGRVPSLKPIGSRGLDLTDRPTPPGRKINSTRFSFTRFRAIGRYRCEHTDHSFISKKDPTENDFQMQSEASPGGPVS